MQRIVTNIPRKKRICQKGPCFAAWSVFGTFLSAGLLIGLASCHDEEEKKRRVKMEHTSVVDLYVRGIRISRKLPQGSYLYRLPAVRCLQEPNELTLRKRAGRTCPGHSLFTYDLLLLPVLLSGCVFCGVFPRNRSGQSAGAGHYDSYFHPRRSLLSADWSAAAGCNRNCHRHWMDCCGQPAHPLFPAFSTPAKFSRMILRFRPVYEAWIALLLAVC